MQKLILAADDNPIVSSLVELTLLKAGFAVQTAPDGVSVLSRLSALAPDLIILDLDMPFVSGLETLRRIKAAPNPCSAPVMMLTASEDVHHMVDARRSGAAGYLVKPFEPIDLVEKVQSLLGDTGVVWVDDVTSVRSIATA